MKITLTLLVVLIFAHVSGCAHHNDRSSMRSDNPGAAIARNVQDCVDVVTSSRSGEGVLDPNNIRLLSWNIKKSQHEHWQRDFSKFTQLSNIVLVQEALLTDDAVVLESQGGSFASFTPGFIRGRTISGVATYSAGKPLAACHFTNTEPLLRTLKATNITLHDMRGRDETLLVVNVHGINFSWGLGEFTRQMQQIADIVSEHAGPVIVAGDFNTWRSRRAALVLDVSDQLGLQAVEFDADHRARFFGNPVDHVYIRGLTVISSYTQKTVSSDHNPLIVELRLEMP